MNIRDACSLERRGGLVDGEAGAAEAPQVLGAHPVAVGAVPARADDKEPVRVRRDHIGAEGASQPLAGR
ncbi:hypothetical protein [Streptomyces griseorubiginosus]|uniref:hypothetical protein n=1 Tax=Streptomyces griseorubiginosus TaxID=67304 RepID=UPI002E8043AD|nr:hypothetical protein [Streptomyces griseorubiginosus]